MKAKNPVKQKKLKQPKKKAPTKVEKQQNELKRFGKITNWCFSKITDPNLQPGSSNANDVNETIPVSNNTVITSTTLAGNDSIVTDNTTTTATTNTTSGLAIDYDDEEG